MGITLRITSLLDDDSDSRQKAAQLCGNSYGKKPNGERPVTAPSPSEPALNFSPLLNGFFGLPRLIH